MKKIMRVVECCDHKMIYGYLEIENATVDEVQKEIYKIKNNKTFQKQHPDWCINDVFARFPSKWKWNFISDDGSAVEI